MTASNNRGLFTATATIASGTSLSGPVFVNNTYLCGIVMPSSWWTSAVMTFQVSRDGGATFRDFYLGASEYVRTEAAMARDLGIPPHIFAGVDAIKVRSGTAADPVNQGAARELRLAFRRYA